jgi:hypothetical protein
MATNEWVQRRTEHIRKARSHQVLQPHLSVTELTSAIDLDRMALVKAPKVKAIQSAAKDLLRERAELFLKLDMFEEALKDVQEVLDIDPEDKKAEAIGQKVYQKWAG